MVAAAAVSLRHQRQWLLTYRHEDLIDIHCGLGWRFHKEQAVVVRICLCFLEKETSKKRTDELEVCGKEGFPVGLLKLFLTWWSTARLLARSALFPASAITIFGLACRCSSFTQFFARVNVSLKTEKAL